MHFRKRPWSQNSVWVPHSYLDSIQPVYPRVDRYFSKQTSTHIRLSSSAEPVCSSHWCKCHLMLPPVPRADTHRCIRQSLNQELCCTIIRSVSQHGPGSCLGFPGKKKKKKKKRKKKSRRCCRRLGKQTATQTIKKENTDRSPGKEEAPGLHRGAR